MSSISASSARSRVARAEAVQPAYRNLLIKTGPCPADIRVVPPQSTTALWYRGLRWQPYLSQGVVVAASARLRGREDLTEIWFGNIPLNLSVETIARTYYASAVKYALAEGRVAVPVDGMPNVPLEIWAINDLEAREAAIAAFLHENSA